jgi:IS1 family transposase
MYVKLDDSIVHLQRFRGSCFENDDEVINKLPSKRHQVGKAGTRHIERHNLNFRTQSNDYNVAPSVTRTMTVYSHGINKPE